MGCNQFSRPQVVVSIVPKAQPPDILKTETINTMSSTNILSLLPSLKSNANYLKPCLKFKLEKPFSKFIIDDNHSSDTLALMTQKVRKFWIFLTAFQNNFGKQVHSVCIKNYSVKDGLIVLTVLAVARGGLSSIVFTKFPPFVEFSKDLEKNPLFKAWKEMNDFLGLVSRKKIVEKFKSFDSKFQEFVLVNDFRSSWYARKALKFNKEFCDCIEMWIEGVKDFIKQFETLKVLILAGAAEVNVSGLTSGSQVVHMLINKIER